MGKALPLFLILVIPCFYLHAQKNKPGSEQALVLKRFIELNHFDPPEFNDAFSNALFKQFLNQIDPYGIYLSTSDRLRFEEFRYKLDDELKGISWQFIDSLIPLLKLRLTGLKNTLPARLSQPLSFTSNDTLIVSLHASNLYRDQSAQWLTYQVLKQMTSPLIYIDTCNCFSGKLLDEAEARNRVQRIEIQKINRLLESSDGFEMNIIRMYFDAITACVDPHTEYLPPLIRDRFLTTLSAKGLSFGITLDENDRGEIVISHLTPGGPAWNSNELHKGDVIIQLKESEKDPVDITCTAWYEVYTLFESGLKGPLEITVRKANGSVKTVSLVQTKIILDENVIKSFVLTGSKKIGYILLPGFYTEFDDQIPLGCANDVAKACIKLQKENIEGLILDIRNNGGGSIKEAIDLAGLFIDYGPVALIRQKNNAPVTLKDLNRGTVYTGPLLVLVNGQSASASELFAAAMQDYNRAIVVGSRTFGKATGQVILPLDTLYSFHSENQLNKNSGGDFIKITEQKIYRISGQSIQQHGLLPDIILPDLQTGFSLFESDLPFALPYDTVVKKTYFTAFNKIPVAMLAEKSTKRIQKDLFFHELKTNNNAFSSYFHSGCFHIPLTIEGYTGYIMMFQQLQSTIEKPLATEKKLFSAHYPNFDSRLISMESNQQEYHKELFRNIENDMVIEEAFSIFSDYLTLIKQ